jgi:hypothetical protein
MTKKKLYTVTVEFEYAALAEDERDALDYAIDALGDVSVRDYARATETVYLPGKDSKTPVIRRPDDYDDDSLVYGADDDTTLAEAIQAEVDELTGVQREAEFDARQGKLFEEK